MSNQEVAMEIERHKKYISSNNAEYKMLADKLRDISVPYLRLSVLEFINVCIGDFTEEKHDDRLNLAAISRIQALLTEMCNIHIANEHHREQIRRYENSTETI